MNRDWKHANEENWEFNNKNKNKMKKKDQWNYFNWILYIFILFPLYTFSTLENQYILVVFHIFCLVHKINLLMWIKLPTCTLTFHNLSKQLHYIISTKLHNFNLDSNFLFEIPVVSFSGVFGKSWRYQFEK